MTAIKASRIGFAVLVSFALGGLGGCGGGSDAAPPVGPNVVVVPPPVANITIADGGTVTSDDGKLQLIVAANSASAEGTATITKITPSAEVLADPSYIPDSAYAYSGPPIDFSPPANWELASPDALASAAIGLTGFARRFAANTSANEIDPEQLCQAPYAESMGQMPQSVWVSGATCPASCSKVRGSAPTARQTRSLCAPDKAPTIVAQPTACPAGSSDASAEPAWAAWATSQQVRVCDPGPAVSAAVLGSSPLGAMTSCAKRTGKFICKRASIGSGQDPDPGTDSAFEDNTPPNSAGHGFQTAGQPDLRLNAAGTGYVVTIADGTAYPLKFRPVADATNEALGLIGVELRELTNVTTSATGAPTSTTSLLMWVSPSKQNAFLGLYPTFTPYVAPEVIVPYAYDDAPVRYFFAVAYDWVGNARRSSYVRIARTSPTAPVIASFSANPNALPIGGGGATTLAWAVNGATTVNILPSIGNVVNPSNGSAVAVVTATTVFTLTATNSFGQTSTSNVIVTVAQDTTPPAVTLASSAASAIVPASVTLTATASDAIGVAKVEFYRGATLIATDTTAPYQHAVSFTAADVGPVTFTARAYDAANNLATSSPVVVSVTDPPGNGDTYASPTGVDAGNATCAQATPCRTIAKAASLAQPNKTVWLLNGAYTGATQPTPINIPSSLTLRAVNAGLAGVGQGIVLQGSGNVIGVVIRRVMTGDTGWIQAASGTVVLDGVRVIGSAFTGAGGIASISLSGTAQATMTPGNIVDYADQLTAIGQGQATYASLAGSARLTINGGLFGGAALGGSANLFAKTGAFSLTGSSRLDINNAVVNVDSFGVVMNGGATQLHMTGSLLRSNVNSGAGAGIFAAGGTPQITLINSSIIGFDYSFSADSRGILVGAFNQPGVAATISANSASLIENNHGIWVVDGTTPSSLTLTGSNVVVSANTLGGMVCYAACSLDIAGGEISENGTQNPAFVGSFSFFGGVWLGAPTKSYFLKLRNVQVIDNRSLLGGNSNQPSNSGITMTGSATSLYDLGISVSPGGNIFAGNTTGSLTTGLNVAVAPGTTVRAVGNTFIPGTQGANAQGKYQLGTAPCGGSSCDLSGGAGANYRVTSGTLRLAE